MVPNVLTDTHCHLNFDGFDNDREEVLERAHKTGVIRVLVPGIDLTSSETAIELAEKQPLVFAAIGVHPNEARSWDEKTIERLRNLAQSPKIVAIGEIGLDYYRERASHELQREVFAVQLSLAAEAELPVIIHIRDKDPNDKQAMKDVIDIIGIWKKDLARKNSSLNNRPGVLHSFSGDIHDADEAIRLGFWIGITGPVTFKKAETLQSVVKMAPSQNLLTETDAPFLTPHPHRGERNEPGYVRYVTEQIAHLRGEDVKRLSETLAANAERLFHW